MTIFGHSAVELRRKVGEARGRTCPPKRFDVVKKGNVGTQRRQLPKQQRAITLGSKCASERTSTGGIDVPFAPIFRDRVQMSILRQDGSRGFRAPSSESRISIRRVTDEREVVGNRFGRNAKLPNHRRFVAGFPCASIQLDDAVMPHTLRKIFVGRADNHAFNTRIGGRSRRAGCQCIVGFEFNHRPDHHTGQPECLLEQWKLRQQVGIDASTSLVARPEIIAERLNHMIGGHGEVRDAGAEHSQHGSHDPSNCGDFTTGIVARGRQRVKVPEQFVRAVNQIDFQAKLQERL